MAISEGIELLGKGLYKDIPDTLTLQSLPTVSELDYIGSEDFDETMLSDILPKAIKEDVNFRSLLEIDYQWICRGLRFINYGPYYTTNLVFCPECGQLDEMQVDMRRVECVPLPDGFTNDIVLSRDEFIDFDGDVHLKLPTIQEVLNARNDNAFVRVDGKADTAYARLCYSIKSIKNNTNMTPMDVRTYIQKNFSAADYQILRQRFHEVTNYGLRGAGAITCPKCKKTDATFIALPDERFFRPVVDDLRRWKADRAERKTDKPA